MGAVEQHELSKSGRFVAQLRQVLLGNVSAWLIDDAVATVVVAVEREVNRHNFAVSLARNPDAVARDIARVVAAELDPQTASPLPTYTDVQIRTAFLAVELALTAPLRHPDGSPQDVTVT